MRLSRFLVLAGFLMASLGSAAEKPMNVLFVVSDDLNTELGRYGSERGVTPNLDAFADSAMRFDRAYCQYPVCNPSRNSFLSGMRPDETGVPEKWKPLRELVPEVTTLPQLFRENGYYTASIGKVFHIGNWDERWPADWGLGDAPSWDFRINCPPANQGASGMPPFPRKGIKMTWPGHSGPIDYGMISFESDLAQEDGQATQEAIRQLDRPRDKPFFLAVGYRRPHAPFVAPEEYYWPYPLDTIDLPEPGDRSDVTDLAFYTHPANYGDPEAMKQLRMCYLASVSFLDAQFGRLIEALEHRGLMKNTIVVFFSDHGFALGEHGDWHKNTLFEVTNRVPLLIHVPGKTRAGAVSERIVGLVDLYPTLRELCGLPEPKQELAGRSLLPLLEDPEAGRTDDAAFMQLRRKRDGAPSVMGYSVRKGDFRYNEWWTETERPERLARELYDLSEDPREEVNRAEDPAYAETRERLSALLAGYTEAIPER